MSPADYAYNLAYVRAMAEAYSTGPVPGDASDVARHLCRKVRWLAGARRAAP